MREVRTFVGQFVIIAALIVCVSILLRKVGLTGTGGSILAFVLIGGLLFWTETVRLRKRGRSIEDAVASFGFYSVDVSDLRLAIYPFRKAGTVRNAVCGNLHGLQSWIFDYEIPDGEDTIAQTVAAFVVADANLPIFELRPRHLDGIRMATQNDGFLECVQFSEVPSFQTSITLKTSAIEHVQRYFKTDLLEKLLRVEDCKCIVQGYYTTVVCFVPGTRVAAEELEAFATRCSEVASALFSSATELPLAKLL
jgi:hypothetical protein